MSQIHVKSTKSENFASTCKNKKFAKNQNLYFLESVRNACKPQRTIKSAHVPSASQDREKSSAAHPILKLWDNMVVVIKT
jgi:hypothetical protein